MGAQRYWQPVGTVAAWVAAGALFPHVVSNPYFLHVANLAAISVLVVLGLNLLTGYAGQISIGHAGFYAIGAYTAALLSLRWHAPFWATLPAGAAAAALVGWLVGRPTLRLKGAYLAMATIGIGEIVQLVVLNWTSLTGGAQGLKGVPAPVLFGVPMDSEQRQFYLIFTVLALAYLLVDRLTASELGLAWRAIKDDETAAQMMGADVARLKVLALVLSAAMAGAAGVLYAHLMNYVSPYGFGFKESVGFLCMALAGGLGRRWGPVLGVGLLTVGREAFRAFADYELVVYGLLLVGISIFMPSGFASLLEAAWNRAWRREARGGAARDVACSL